MEQKSEMNCERLNELALWLEAGAPETPAPGLKVMGEAAYGDTYKDFYVSGFDMCLWVHDRAKKKGQDTVCGSVCCLGGTAVSLWGGKDDSIQDMGVAARILGLDIRKAKALFYPGSGLDGLGEDSSHPGWQATPAQAARVVRHLMATGVADWSPKIMGAP